ncbi:MAG: secretin N-terminal domain-containing protein [Candidatus Rokuibacteriota bacterium]
MARRGVVLLLGCAWTVAAVGAGASWAGDQEPAGQPVLLAQARAPIVAQQQPPRQQPRLISLDFKDADINNVLRILAEFSGLNIVTSEDVKGKVTVKLTNVPWQQALDSVVRAAKLAYVQEGNIIRVDRLENLTKEAEAQFRADQRDVEISQKREEFKVRLEEQERARKAAEEEAEFRRREREFRLEQERQKAAAEAEKARREAEFLALPLVEEVITLKYAHVGVRRSNTINFLTDAVTTEERKGIEETIRGSGKPGEGKGLLSPRGELTTDPRTNSLIIRDVPDNLAKIKEFIAKVDRPTPAIQIEARVVEMTKRDSRSLGVIWGGSFTPRTGSNSPVVSVTGAAPGADKASSAVSLPAPAASLAGFAANPFGLALGWLASNLALDIQLQALEGEGRARVVSSPSLMTLDNEPATLASGTKFPIISVTVVGGAQQASITFQDVTTRLQVTPRVVAGENKLFLGIAVKRETVADTVTAASLVAPIVTTRNAVTQAEIPDGGTIVLGGLREETQATEQQGIPWLRKIPVLGWLFKNDLTEGLRSELVVFLTAKIVERPGQAAVTPAELPAAPGTPAPPGPTGEKPTSPLPAVSSVAPRPAPQPLSEVGSR